MTGSAMATSRIGTLRARAAAMRGAASGGLSPKRKITKPSPNRSSVERPSASHACGARAPGRVDGTNRGGHFSGGGVPSGTQIGESS